MKKGFIGLLTVLMVCSCSEKKGDGVKAPTRVKTEVVCTSAISSSHPLFSKASSLWSSTIKTRRRGKQDIDLLPPPTKRRSMSLRLTNFSFFGNEKLFLIIYKIPAKSTCHRWVLLRRSLEVERKPEIPYSLCGSRTECSNLYLTRLHIWEVLV